MGDIMRKLRVVEEPLDTGHGDRTRQHDRAHVRANAAQVFESLDRSDLSGRHTQQGDWLAGTNGWER